MIRGHIDPSPLWVRNQHIDFNKDYVTILTLTGRGDGAITALNFFVNGGTLNRMMQCLTPGHKCAIDS